MGKLKYLSEKDRKIWENALASMIRECYKAGNGFLNWKIVYSFAFSDIVIIKKTDLVSDTVPVVVLCVKNDLKKIQMLVSHYRKLGIEKFAIMDNGSDDGTFEWLDQQKDVDLFLTRDKYQTRIKEGWINWIIRYYGFNHWYLLTDSDELITYVGMEKHPLNEVIAFAKRANIKRFKGLLIDMYTSGKLFDHSGDIFKEYRWMDTGSYTEKERMAGACKFMNFVGGPRQRVMGFPTTVSKYPLCYFEEGTVSSSAHFQYPFDLLQTAVCYMGILHYKFTEEDLEKYKEIARFGKGYSKAGKAYKCYMDYINKEKDVSFMSDDSVEYTDSDSLKKIDLIKQIEF